MKNKTSGGALFKRAAPAALAACLVACGGGGGDGPKPDATASSYDIAMCSTASQKKDLRAYMRDWYYFTFSNHHSPLQID